MLQITIRLKNFITPISPIMFFLKLIFYNKFSFSYSGGVNVNCYVYNCVLYNRGYQNFVNLSFFVLMCVELFVYLSIDGVLR